jgi:DNA (cytosine-5)-methyltransferase 1
MSLGVKMAAEALGLRFESLVAADFAKAALDVYEANLRPALAFRGNLAKAIRRRLRGGRVCDVRLTDRDFRARAKGVDVLIGGPPCQGHSDLNNHSRRDDPKNSLYLLMPAVALALRPSVVIIENVPAVVHDRRGVVDATVATLVGAGYTVTPATVPMVEVGVAQTRRRHFLIAVLGKKRVDAGAVIRSLRTAARPVSWAIDDLQATVPDSVFDSASVPSDKNRKRIDWLFENDEFDLPNPHRPTCHRDKQHSYVSMYGRMRWGEPAQTITSGFGSPGQGRYIHPTRRTTLTPHEAARLQFFPDSYRFEPEGRALGRSELAVMIGNAVPPKASYVLALGAIAALEDFSRD